MKWFIREAFFQPHLAYYETLEDLNYEKEATYWLNIYSNYLFLFSTVWRYVKALMIVRWLERGSIGIASMILKMIIPRNFKRIRLLILQLQNLLVFWVMKSIFELHIECNIFQKKIAIIHFLVLFHSQTGWNCFQCYVVFVQEHGGQDLESFVLLNFDEARSLLVQVYWLIHSIFS